MALEFVGKPIGGGLRIKWCKHCVVLAHFFGRSAFCLQFQLMRLQTGQQREFR